MTSTSMSRLILRPSVLRHLACQYSRNSFKTSSRKLSSLPVAVKVSPEEAASESLSWQNLELATRALHRDGLVVLEDVIDHERLDRLNSKMNQDAQTLQSLGDASPFNYNKGNIQQDPPATSQYFDTSILLNSLATQVTSSVLGPRPRLSFLSGNTALPPTPDSPPQSQPVHSDADFDHPSCPFALVVNVPLVEMTPENGSTEVWLGTHSLSSLAVQEGRHGERASGRIKKDLLEKRARERPPAQPLVKKGSLVIRDLRLWHAGKPNYTQETRVMLAMIHFAPWFRNAMQVEYSEALRSTLAKFKNTLQIQSTFLPEKEVMSRYLNRGFGNAYKFDQEDRIDNLIRD